MYRLPILPVNSILLYKRYDALPLKVDDSGENYYQVYINGVDTKKISLIVKDKQGRVWVPAEDLATWHIMAPGSGPTILNEQKYYSIGQFSGASYKIDSSDLSIKLELPASAFMPQEIVAGDQQFINMNTPAKGAYFNYNVVENRNVHTTPNNTILGDFQLGIFNEYGIGTNSFVLQNTADTEWAVRLLTTWRYDEPDKMWTMSLGDDISASTPWSSSVNFGGVQWGTNFDTQPAFITFPQPGYVGQATVPSQLDLLINNSLSNTATIMPGDYAISNIPYVDGAGNMRIVTTDILGRQQVVNLTFYVSNQLLKAGLVDSTYEFGLIRQNLGLASFDYARFIAAATRAVGITNDFTLQWHVEGLSDQQTAGASFFKQIGQFGVLNGSCAVSHINSGSEYGGLGLLGFQRQTPSYSFGLSSQVTTWYFTQQGLTPGDLSPRLINQAFGGVVLGKSSVNVNYVRQINREQPGNNMLTATFSRNLFFDFSLSLTGTTNLGGTKNKGVFINITRSLGEETNFNTSNSIQNDSHQETIQVQRSLPPGPGYGYNLVASTGTSTNAKQASYSYQNNVGTYSAQLLQVNNQETTTLNAQGSIIWMGDHSYFSRNIQTDSFAVVQVPGFKDVDVSINNQVAAHTDKYGNALIPDLLAYQDTAIVINTNQLPLNSAVDKSSITVAPYYNSGLIVRFPVRLIHSATLTVKQVSGDYVPEGVSAGVAGKPPEFIVGELGQTYLTGLEEKNTIDFIWDEHVCEISFTMPAPDPNNPVPDLGTFVCHEVTNEKAKKAAIDAVNAASQ